MSPNLGDIDYYSFSTTRTQGSSLYSLRTIFAYDGAGPMADTADTVVVLDDLGGPIETFAEIDTACNLASIASSVVKDKFLIVPAAEEGRDEGRGAEGSKSD